MPTGLPPWLDFTPQTYLGAMEAGTRAGTAMRSQDISQSEAADRLKLAYDSLSEKERMANVVAQYRHEANKAAMELRAAQMQGLQDYREAQLGAREKALDLSRQLGEARLGLAAQKLESQGEPFETFRDKAGNLFLKRKGSFYHVPELKPPMDTVTEITPETRGTPAVPAQPAIPPKTILGIPIPFTGQEAVPGKPEVPPHGEIRRTRRIPADLSAGQSLTNAPAAATAPRAQSKPLPASKADMVKGERYTVKGRDWIWDGDKLVSAD